MWDEVVREVYSELNSSTKIVVYKKYYYVFAQIEDIESFK